MAMSVLWRFRGDHALVADLVIVHRPQHDFTPQPHNPFGERVHPFRESRVVHGRRRRPHDQNFGDGYRASQARFQQILRHLRFRRYDEAVLGGHRALQQGRRQRPRDKQHQQPDCHDPPWMPRADNRQRLSRKSHTRPLPVSPKISLIRNEAGCLEAGCYIIPARLGPAAGTSRFGGRRTVRVRARAGRRGAKTARTYIALLRGINVVGKNRLPMKDLAAVFRDAGCERVQTYIQSGNVVFQAAPALARRVPALITEAISKSFGYRVPVVTRTADDLREIARGNPFLRSGADASTLHVMFLMDLPAAPRVAALDPGYSAPDAFQVRGREIYVHLPGGMARTRLTNQYFDSKLGTTSTARNWRTVLKLLDLVRVS